MLPDSQTQLLFQGSSIKSRPGKGTTNLIAVGDGVQEHTMVKAINGDEYSIIASYTPLSENKWVKTTSKNRFGKEPSRLRATQKQSLCEEISAEEYAKVYRETAEQEKHDNYHAHASMRANAPLEHASFALKCTGASAFMAGKKTSYMAIQGDTGLQRFSTSLHGVEKFSQMEKILD